MVWRLCNVANNGSRRQRRIRAEDRAMIFSLTPHLPYGGKEKKEKRSCSRVKVKVKHSTV